MTVKAGAIGEARKRLKCAGKDYDNGGLFLPYYILLSTLTPEGTKTVKDRPERIKEVNREIETLGAKILYQFAVLGPYDFVNILEAPDNETVYQISTELSARGTVKILSMPAIKVDDLIDGLKKGRRQSGGKSKPES